MNSCSTLICFGILSTVNQDFLVLITMLLLIVKKEKQFANGFCLKKHQLNALVLRSLFSFFFLSPVMIAIGFSSFRGRHGD